MAGDDVVLRVRLLEQLAGRFDARVTTLIGSGGFGKTMALAQATEQNAMAGLGRDVWIGCAHGDDPKSLTTTIVAGLSESSADGVAAASRLGPTEQVSQAVWSLAPADVALIFDDVHELGNDPECVEFLTSLVKALPTNGHLVFSSREQIPVPLSRVRSQGELLEIGQDDLAFDPAECATFLDVAGVHDVDIDVEGLRWPALARLRADSGLDAAIEYIWDEVLAGLDATKREHLGVMAAFPFVDDDLVQAVTSSNASAESLLAGLPLVDRRPDGVYKIHDLWRPILEDEVSPSRRREALQAGARRLLDRGDVVAAGEVFAIAEDPEGLTDTAIALCSSPLTVLRVDEATRILRLLADVDVDPGLTRAIEAIIHLGEFEPRALTTLTEAAELLAEGDQPLLEIHTLFLTSQLSGLIHGLPPSPELIPRARELMACDDEAAAALARAMVDRFEICELLVQGLSDKALARRDELRPFGGPRARMLIETLQTDAGWPELVGDGSLADLGGLAASGDLEIPLSYALWIRGELDPEQALEVAQSLIDLVSVQRMSHQTVLLLGVVALVAIAAGEPERARALIAEANADAPDFGPRLMGFVRSAEAAILVHEGDESAARAVFEGLVDQVPLGQWPPRVYLHVMAPLYILVPSSRELLSSIRTGPALRLVIEAATALVDFRSTGSTDAAVDLDWSRVSTLRANLWPAHLTELALAAREGGSRDAEQVLEQIVGQRSILEHLVNDGGKVKEAAIAALNALPVGPGFTLRVNVLGQMQILRDGIEIDDNDWQRREKVRLLFAYLVQHPSVSRRDLAAALWPNVDMDKALANVRANLRFLLRALEPDRPTGADSWFIETEGRVITLRRDRFEFDVDDFDRLLEGARKADGRSVPGEALGLYQNAIAMFRSDYLEESFQDPWAEFERIRLRSAAALASTRVAELLLAKGEPEMSISAASWALGCEPLLERAHRGRIRAFLALEDRNAARHAGALLLDAVIDAGMELEYDSVKMLENLGLERPEV